MYPAVHRYCFAPSVAPEDVEGALLLALVGVEALYGESRVRLDAGFSFDPATRVCVLDASTEVGRDMSQLFLGFLRSQLGADAFRVERLADREAMATTVGG
jgi:hypothetical protein